MLDFGTCERIEINSFLENSKKIQKARERSRNKDFLYIYRS